MNSFGGAAAATGFLMENKKLSRPDSADGALRTGAGVDRLRSDAFVLRILRCLTFEVSWRRRRDALDSKRKMGRRPCA